MGIEDGEDNDGESWYWEWWWRVSDIEIMWYNGGWYWKDTGWTSHDNKWLLAKRCGLWLMLKWYRVKATTDAIAATPSSDKNVYGSL